jgi:hypothetical protein
MQLMSRDFSAFSANWSADRLRESMSDLSDCFFTSNCSLLHQSLFFSGWSSVEQQVSFHHPNAQFYFTIIWFSKTHIANSMTFQVLSRTMSKFKAFQGP